MNCGVVFTVKFGRVTQRKNAAKVICSMSLCNIFYLLFVIIFAVPMRFGLSGDWNSFCLMCHLAQVGSNAPKAVITAHHLVIAVDTFWLIKKPFEYANLSILHMRQYLWMSWVVPGLYVLVFDSLTLCFYETLSLNKCTPRADQHYSMVPDLVNILVNFALYSLALGYIMFLYAQVFSEALGRMRRRHFPHGERRASLTSDCAIACMETYKQEMRLIRGFVVLVVAALMTACIRNSYYLVCFIIGCDDSCSSGGRWRDTVFSTFTGCSLLLVTCFTPYAYFYRNPLFQKAFYDLLRDKVCRRGNRASRPPSTKAIELLAKA
ncbi:uncharacterized protein LOC134844869 isoform X2 [Symsagittifera roscoffensis]